MTQTLAGTIAGPITLADANATILAGAQVYWAQTAAGCAVVAPVGVVSTVANAGTIAAYVGYGIEFGAGTFVNTTGGAVVASLVAVTNASAGGPLTVVNQGRIIGAQSGILLGPQGYVSNAAGADIAGGGVGVGLAAGGTVDNAGTVSSYTIGIRGAGFDDVTNQAGGRLYGGSQGVAGISLLDNAGLVAAGTAGVGATATLVLNRASGTIRGATAVAADTLENSGTLYGVALGALAATLTNAGRILVGPGGTGLRLTAGAAGRLVLQPAYYIQGRMDLGGVPGASQGSVLELAGGGAAAATYLGGLGTTIVDLATIAVDAGANWVFGALDTIAAYQNLAVAGTLASGARVAEGAASGIVVTGGRLTNTGTIDASGTAVDVAGGYLANTGTIASAGTLGVHLAGGATFSDGGAGWLAAAGDAVRADAGAPSLIELPGDPQRVSGTVDGGNPIGGAAVSTLVIAGGPGTLAGLGSHYIDVGLVELPSAVTASGTNIVAPGQTVVAYRLITTDRFVNQGTLLAGSGGLYVRAGTLQNAGTIDGARVGIVEMNAGGETVVNTGTVRGHGGVGIVLTAGATLVNAAGGLVAADSSAFGAGITLASFAAQLAGGGLVTNAGTLAARYGVIGGGTVIDAGTIAGSSGTAVSFQGSLGASRLVVQPGAAFAGGLDGGQTAAGGGYTTTLEFAAGTGTLSGFGTSISNFGAIALDPGAAWLLAGSGAGLAAQPVADLGASTLELTGTVESYVAFAGGRLTLSGGTTLDLPGLPAVHVANDGLDTFVTACLATGSRIATARGPVAVQALAVGELVVTASGRLAPVVWLGRRTLDLARHARPEAVMPVRIRAGAFAGDLPERDLILSPDHAVLVGGMLVPVRHLVNGASIVQERWAGVTYWHLELGRHDVILAEGLACETYLDTGNRGAFAGGARLDLHPDWAACLREQDPREQDPGEEDPGEQDPGEQDPGERSPGAEPAARAVWAARGCAAILTDPADLALRARHTALLARAAAPRFRRAGFAATLVA